MSDDPAVLPCPPPCFTRQNGTFCRVFRLRIVAVKKSMLSFSDFGAGVGDAQTQRGFVALAGKAARPQPSGWWRGAARMEVYLEAMATFAFRNISYRFVRALLKLSEYGTPSAGY
jgi:hypothetical protein